MCRMYAAYVSEVGLAQRLHQALSRAASDDEPRGPHGDGWGYALVTPSYMSYFSSLSPIWVEGQPSPPAQPPALLIEHARQASAGAKDAARAHPIVVRTPTRLVALAHNGTFDPGPLAAEIGFASRRGSDSEVLAHYIASRCELLEEDDVTSCYEGVLAKVSRGSVRPTSLDSMVLYVDLELGEASLWAVQAALKEGDYEYYTLYRASLDGGSAVVSSTLVKVLGGNYKKWSPLGGPREVAAWRVGSLRMEAR